MAVDISGRHAEQGKYKMLCAAVSARISPESIEKINSVRLMPQETEAVDFSTIADFISSVCMCLPGTILAEPGDMYNLEVWRVSSILGRDFKYPETLAERTAVELAHHISVAGRRLMIDVEELNSNE